MIEIERVGAIIRDSRWPGDRSLRQLIDESGYREIPPSLTIQALQEMIEGNTDLIDGFHWSARLVRPISATGRAGA